MSLNNHKWRLMIVPAVLIIVAATHMIRHYSFNQSSWGAGCGFGMFATVDNHQSRFFQCRLVTPSGIVPANIDGISQYQNLKSRVIPTEAELTELARQLAGNSWKLNSEKIAVPSKQPDAQNKFEHQPVQSIQLSLYGVEFDVKAKQINRRLLSSIELPLDNSKLYRRLSNE